MCFDRPYDAKNPYLAPVCEHRELHKGGDRSCMHIEFDISGSKLRYDAGDHVAVFPTNDAEIVDKLGARLNVDLGTVFTLTNVDGRFDNMAIIILVVYSVIITMFCTLSLKTELNQTTT